MSQVLLQRRVREEGGTSASSSESPAAEEEENDSEDNRVALCSYITHLLQRVLRVCEGEYVRSFLTLATTKYLPWRLQLYNSISQCYQQFGFTYEAYRTASLAYHKTRELIEIEYMDVILPPEEQQRVLETGLQKAILLKMQYTWEVMAADGTAGEANPAPLNNNESGAQHTFELLQRLPRDGSDLLSIVFHHLKKHAFLPKYSTANTEEVRKVRLYEDFPKLAMYICHNIIQSTRRPSRVRVEMETILRLRWPLRRNAKGRITRRVVRPWD
ncbi:hypothetical protein ADEAN_000789700 [Angomonas deanei]|uniref:Uncharacterized protein n=1 Tax=Angomonas deanei TaxID=59799 RepID=A0A7G2CLS6_9TRYP|nr:hypothetical protein ADEAN_000789700 [Angomonas deanei]